MFPAAHRCPRFFQGARNFGRCLFAERLGWNEGRSVPHPHRREHRWHSVTTCRTEVTIGGGTNAHDGWRGLLRSVVGGFETGEGGEGTWMERRTPPSLLFWRPDDYECGYGWWMWMGPTIYPKRSMISKQNLKTKTCTW